MRGQRVFDNYIYAYRFQVASGVRPGELVGLQIGDITNTGDICIKRSINHIKKSYKVKIRMQSAVPPHHL